MVASRLVILSLFLSVVLPLESMAQTLRGRVVDAGSAHAIAQATIRLVSLDGKPIAEVVSTDSGHFEILAPRSGRYNVEADRIEYVTMRGGPIRLLTESTAEVEIRLSIRAVALEPIEVKVEARKPSLVRAGFYDRQRTGLGTFIDEADIEARNARRTTDLFRAVAGVRVISDGRNEHVVLRGGIGSSFTTPYCRPQIYLDGIHVEPFDLGREISPYDLEGIEIYRSAAQVPAQYGGANSSCGVILLWTRK
jgi:hypothetical protein